MPIYETTLPDGQPLQIIGPPGATPQEISQAAIQIASQQTPPPSTVTPNYTLGRAITGGFDTGVERLKSTFGDVIPAMAANALGFEDYAKKQMEEARRSEEKIARKYAPEFESFKDVDSLGGAARFVAGTIAEQGPNLLTMVGSGGVPAIGAKLTAKAFAIELAKKYPKMATKEIIKRVAKRQGLAQNVGVFLGSYSLNAPEVFNNVYQETGQLETGTALLFGAAAASLDSILPATILKKLTPLQKTEIAGAALLKSGANPSLVNKVFKGLVKGAATEGVTEGMQEAISISAENYVAGNPQIFGSEDWDRIMESAVRGAIAGGFFRGVSSPFEGSESESLLNTLDKPTGTPGLDTGDVDLTTTQTDEAAKANEEAPLAALNTGAELGKNIAKGTQGELSEAADIEQATPAEEAMAIETGVAAQAAELELPYEGFRPPSGMTLEAGIEYYNNLDGLEQINYEPPQEAIQDESTTIDATDGTETPGRGNEIPFEPTTGETAAESGSPIGGEVAVDTNIIPTTGGRENVSDVALSPENITAEQQWDEMSVSEVPFSALKKEDQLRLIEAQEEGELTGQLVDEIDIAAQDTFAGLTFVKEGKKYGRYKAKEGFIDKDGRPQGGKEFIENFYRRDEMRPANENFPGGIGNLESRADTEGTGQTAATITTDLVEEFGNNINKMIEKGKLVIVDNVSQLPANITMSSTANGAFDNNSGISYLVADRIQKGQGRRVLLHEIGEHYGLEKMVGKDYMPLLNRLKTLRKQNPEVQAIFDEVQELYPEFEVDSKPFLQEVMAKVGERAPNNTLFRRMVGAVKNFLRRLGLYNVNNFNDADIQDMILNSLRVSLAEATGTVTREQASGTPALQMSEEVEATAGVNIEQARKLLGSNIYGKANTAAVTIKELLQNAADSLKGLLAKGTIEDGRIDITIGRPFVMEEYENVGRVISMKDNGTGMTPETLSTTFITTGESDKDPDASGGFGVAKEQFLFAAKSVNVVTMRDGVISELVSTGKALDYSANTSTRLPKGTIKKHSPKEYSDLMIEKEEARTGEKFRIYNNELNIDNFQPYMRLFPKGQGTIVEIEIPNFYIEEDASGNVEEKEIEVSRLLSSYPELENSPLFATSPDGNVVKKSNIDVTFQGSSASKALVPIGANFPTEDYATNIDVEFSWGSAKIIVSKEEVKYPYPSIDKNVTILSNGLYQFQDVLRVDPKERYGELIQRKFFIDIKSKIQPGERGYPFANNRQSLTPAAKKDLGKIENYVQKEFGQLQLTNQFNSIANTKFQILRRQKDGSVIAVDIPSLAKAVEKNAQDIIEETQDLKLTDAGELVNRKTNVPIFTAKEMEEVQISAEGLQIEKDVIPTDEVIIHDNLETSLRDIGEDQLAVNLGDNQEYVPITQLAREKFGSRFDTFMNEIGEAFLLLRNQVIMLGNLEKGQVGKLPRDYNKLADNVVGISFDVSFRGVNIGGVPFEGVFVNPGAVEFTNSPEEASQGMFMTMIHEMAHFYEKDHEVPFTQEIARLANQLEAAGMAQKPLLSGKKPKLRSTLATKKALAKSIRDNEDIFKFLNSINQPGEIYDYGKSRQQIRPIGERFETSDLEVRDERVTENIAETREQGRAGPERVSRDTRKRDTTKQRERQPESVSPESKTTQESRVDNKNIQFSKENPPGGYNPIQYSRGMEYAGEQYSKLPIGTKKYLQGTWDSVRELKNTVRKQWMGMLGLQAMADLYQDYLPSINTLINVLERRAAKVEKSRGEVDVLGNLGMDIINPAGKERKLIKYNEKTGAVELTKDGEIVMSDKTTNKKHSLQNLKKWEETTYNLSIENIDPRDEANVNEKLVRDFFNLDPELQALSIAYSTKFEKYGDELLASFMKNVGEDVKAKEQAKKIQKDFLDNRLKFYHPLRRKGNYKITYVSNQDLKEHEQIKAQIESDINPYGKYSNTPITSSAQKTLLLREEGKRFAKLVTSKRYETEAEYLREKKKLDADDNIDVQNAGVAYQNTRGDESSAAAVSVMEDVVKVLGRKKENEKGDAVDIVDPAIVEEVRNIFLDLLPTQSIKQQTRTRAGTQGYIEDLVGGYIDLGARMATQIANLEFVPEIDRTLTTIKEENTAEQQNLTDNADLTEEQTISTQQAIAAATEELTSTPSRSFFHNPVASDLSSRFAYLSYLFSIAGNISSALVNATQLAIVVYPMLVANHGFAVANKAMGQAFKLYFSGGKDNNRGILPDISFGMSKGQRREDWGDYTQAEIKNLKKLYEVGINNSVFRRGVGYELTEMRKTNAKDFVGKKAKFDAVMGWMFQNTERMNREVTYIAGFLGAQEKSVNTQIEVSEKRLKRKLTEKEINEIRESDFTFDQAEKDSREITRRSHGTALPEVGPRFFQTGFGKVAFTFKRFGHAMMHLMIKGFNDAYRGETKEVRNIARKQMLGVYGMTFMFAGLQGVPLYGFTQALSEAMYAMFGDDDEPYDFEESTRDIFGDIGYKGPLNKIINLDIASRTGFANLIWREDPRRISEVGLIQYVLEQGLGPSFSIGLSATRGITDMGRGNIYRGFEQMVPAFARNPLKAFRYGTEGALNRKGAEIYPLSAVDGFFQIFGFTNEDLALQYARNQSMKQAEKNYNARRSGLLTMAYLARKNGDRDLEKEVQEKIDKFNRSALGSTNPITSKTKNKSYKTRERSLDESVGGISLNKKVADVIRKEMGS